ncbi:pyridoxal phosphate-dependent aminotransferase [Methanobacterium ferruginis]|uniref:pyridoxal phosphate-dependent aminotransferase n=1 Tax=Methanobacterium ferruginis TaxID=710191 RepID=UPI002572E8E5|nr:pyridoxal phosphate-dependent aminotransferase [Methanobacterium ferruginis]
MTRLETGEPHIPPPINVKNAVKKALDGNKTFYSHSKGIYQLRIELCNYYNQLYDVDFKPETDILITPGAKQALLYTILGSVDAGEEVIIPIPSWVTYSEIVKIAGGNPILVDCEENHDFELSSDIIDDNLNEKTKVVIINSPNNPTGKIIPQKTLKEINEICLENDILLVCDEIYDRMIYDEKHHNSILSVNSNLNNCVLINGFSKTYSMTGWRLGYIISNSTLINVFTKFQQNSITCPNTFAQFGAIEALSGGGDFVRESLDIYQKNRDYLLSEIEKLKNFDIIKPEGGLYVFIKVSKVTTDTYDFCFDLLERFKISLLPGEEFGNNTKEYVRICLGTNLENLEKFIAILKNNYE